jgi:hypothetical protein
MMTADVHSCLLLATILSLVGIEMDWRRKQQLKRRLEDAESTLKAHGFIYVPAGAEKKRRAGQGQY